MEQIGAVSLFKGHEATVTTDSLGGAALGKVQSITLNINNNLEAFFKIGSRTADTIKEGNLNLTGSITMALVDKTEVLDLVVATSPAADTIYFQISDGESTFETIDLTFNNLYWDTWTTTATNDGSTVFETATFVMKTLTVDETTN